MVTNDKEKPLFSKFSKVDQIGIVVKDMEATMKFYEKMFGIEPFPTRARDGCELPEAEEVEERPKEKVPVVTSS